MCVPSHTRDSRSFSQLKSRLTQGELCVLWVDTRNVLRLCRQSLAWLGMCVRVCVGLEQMFELHPLALCWFLMGEMSDVIVLE